MCATICARRGCASWWAATSSITTVTSSWGSTAGWVKATPAFDKTLCDRFGVLPLGFDGRTDSIFHPYDRAGRRHMEYLLDRGVHADVPVAEIMAIFEREYPRLVERGAGESVTRFREEAR
jgi:hypothetical protein